MTFEEAKQQAIDRSERVLCHIEVYFGMERNGLISALEVRILPPRDPPGDGGRREGVGQVFTGTQLHTL